MRGVIAGQLRQVSVYCVFEADRVVCHGRLGQLTHVTHVTHTFHGVQKALAQWYPAFVDDLHPTGVVKGAQRFRLSVGSRFVRHHQVLRFDHGPAAPGPLAHTAIDKTDVGEALLSQRFGHGT